MYLIIVEKQLKRFLIFNIYTFIYKQVIDLFTINKLICDNNNREKIIIEQK